MSKAVFVCMLLCGCFCGPLSAQWTLSGVVRSEEGEALPGATVFTNDSIGVYTDAGGYFSIKAPRKPQALTVRSLGYFPQRKTLDFPAGSNTLRIDFTLTANVQVLPEASVTVKKLEAIVEENQQSHLYDFGFAGNNLLLLQRIGKKYWLHLSRPDGVLLDKIQLPYPATILHKSCFGNFHAVSTSFAWEVTLAGSRLDTFPRYDAALFHQLVQPCVTTHGDQIVFYAQADTKQWVRYFYADSARQAHHLALVVDENAHRYVQRQVLKLAERYNRIVGLDGYEGIQSDLVISAKLEHLIKLAEDNKAMELLGFIETLKRDSVYAPMLRVGRELYLFDHINGKIVHYQADLSELPEEVPIDYQQNRSFKKQILVDEDTGKSYARFFENESVVLGEIDLQTGRLIKKWPLDALPYLSDQFRLKSGMLFFIGQPGVNDPNRKLYRANVFSGKW